jgi:hypothetical protein
MAFEYECDAAKQRVVVRMHGVFQADEVFDIFARQRNDGSWGHGLLVDLRFLRNPPAVRELTQFVREDTLPGPNNERRGPLAVVVSNPLVYGVACAYAALAGARRHMQVFHDLIDADEWLSQQSKTSMAR